jgi:hypothetical protein
MSHEHKQRPATLEDIARELVKGESLEVQLAMSTLVAKARQVANRPIVGMCSIAAITRRASTSTTCSLERMPTTCVT